MEALWLALAVLAGCCLSLQAATNSSLRSVLGDARQAAFFSIVGTFLTAAAFVLATRLPLPSAATMRSAPWWNWLGGPLGSIVVLSGAALTHRLGTAAFAAAVVGGQLVLSLVIDHFGLLNVPMQPLSAGRLLGAAMVFAGVLCVKYL